MPLRFPTDEFSAREVMTKFSALAYSSSHLNKFQDAVNILYGPEFRITLDFSKRMQFSCQICNREMNSENAMAEHFRSGSHQKNIDKQKREDKGVACHYPRNSIQYKLLNGHVAPVGLQTVTQFINGKNNVYFLCSLCGAHGKIDIMYHHLTAKKHTEKYITSTCVLASSILTPNEREQIRQQLVKIEGIDVDAIKIVKGDDLYPFKWEAEGMTSKLYNEKIKKEPERSLSNSPSHGPSGSGYVRRLTSRSPHGRQSRAPFKKKEYSSGSSDDGSRRPSPNRKQNPLPETRSEGSPVVIPAHLMASTPSAGFSVTGLMASMEAQILSSQPQTLVEVKTETLSPLVQVKTEPLSPVVCAGPSMMRETKDAGIQTKVSVDDVMTELSSVVKNYDQEGDSLLNTPKEVRWAIDLMEVTTLLLQNQTATLLQDCTFKSDIKTEVLMFQKEKQEKILAYIKRWYRPTSNHISNRLALLDVHDK